MESKTKNYSNLVNAPMICYMANNWAYIYKHKWMIICEHNYRIFCCCVCTLNDIMLIYVQPLNIFTTRLNDYIYIYHSFKNMCVCLINYQSRITCIFIVQLLKSTILINAIKITSFFSGILISTNSNSMQN